MSCRTIDLQDAHFILVNCLRLVRVFYVNDMDLYIIMFLKNVSNEVCKAKKSQDTNGSF